jgi:hypothetical protein
MHQTNSVRVIIWRWKSDWLRLLYALHRIWLAIHQVDRTQDIKRDITFLYLINILFCILDLHTWFLLQFWTLINVSIWARKPITAAARSKAWTVFALPNTGTVGSNPTQGMDVYVRLFCVSLVLYVGSDLATGWSVVQGVLPTVYMIKKLKNWTRSNKGL